ncbi:MAG: ADP-ribosylation factor-like protein [Candidatus Helarchaeota archaeon]|nr:ADP-ribosylation factor-like protein [Candidatus Helarchaeota archaeon]
MKQFKVIFIGLSAAGKTSILSVLDKQFHRLANLVPTKGVERSLSTILGFAVNKWDLGGQDKYRQEYLTTKQETLLQTDLVVFVVDMQDRNNYTQALNYYKRVLEIIKAAGEHPHIVLCLHKLDPEVYDQYKANLTSVMKMFSDASQGWDYRFFITSVYNRRSIVEAFSFGIAQFLPKKKSLDVILRNFVADAKESGAKIRGIMLWDQNALFLSMIFDDKKTEKASLNASMGIIETIESFEREDTFSSLVLEINRDFQFHVKKVGQLYTTIIGQQLDFDKVWELYDEHYLTDIEEVAEKEE